MIATLFYTKRPTFSFNPVKTNESKNLKKFQLNLYCLGSHVIYFHARVAKTRQVTVLEKGEKKPLF